MPDIERLILRWQSAGVLDAATAERIRTYESEQVRPTGLRWQGIVALVLGALLLACGVLLFVSAHWDELGPMARFVLVVCMVAVFHIGGALTRQSFAGLSISLHAAGTASAGGAIALVGQIFNLQEHWPAAILLWALCAAAGWILLHDQAQQTMTLLLFPAWLGAEVAFYTSHHIGQSVYLGRLLCVWSLLYLTLFLSSRRRATQNILFAVAAVGAVVGFTLMMEGWGSGSAVMTSAPLATRFWSWTAIAAPPLLFSLFQLRKSFVPVAIAILVSIALPWLQHISVETFPTGNGRSFTLTHNEPNLIAHILVAAFAVFIIAWGVRQVSRSLVNLGIVYFAIAVVWFYFSNLYDKMGRSLGLIGLGILFLLGGWMLERTRRGLIAQMTPDLASPPPSSGVA